MFKKIFVGNLPYNTDEAQLSEWFAHNGFPAESVSLATDRISGQPRGFGFIELNEKLVERCVLCCNGRDFLGRTLIINDARQIPDRPFVRVARRALSSIPE